MRVLVLGGTTESTSLARLLAGDARFDVIVSLAGRTRQPRPQPVAVRSGGFGGADGLAAWLRAERIAAVIDATHPYAAQISANAVAACARTGVTMASIPRPAWQPGPGDRWIEAATPQAAVDALGVAPRRVFLSLGRLELQAFARAPQHHYVARLIEQPEGIALPPRLQLIYARGPFDETAERDLLIAHRIDTIVSKNSGGAATYAKIAAARALSLPVVMIDRPHKPAGTIVPDALAARAWLEMMLSSHEPASPSARGV